MRVTNGMIRNTALRGMNQSANKLNKLFGQYTTQKKIQTVADDPIIAGRTMKLQTTVSDITQYQENAKEAESWMNVSEGSIGNIEKVLETVRKKCLEVATGTKEASDKDKINTELQELVKEILSQTNTSYANRYVFSGFKTQEPPILTAELTLGSDTTLALGTTGPKMTLVSGTKIAAGSNFKEKSVISRGSKLGAGTTIKAADVLGLCGIKDAEMPKYKVDSDYIVPDGTIIESPLAKELGLVDDYSSYTVTAAHPVTITAGTSLSAEAKTKYDGLPAGHPGLTPCTHETSTLIKIEPGTRFTNAEAQSLKAAGIIEVAPDSGDYVVGGTGLTIPKKTLLSDAVIPIICKGEGINRVGSGDGTVGANGFIANVDSYETNEEISFAGESTLEGGSQAASGSSLKAGTVLPKDSFNPIVFGKTDGQKIEYQIGNNNNIDINVLGIDSIISNLMKVMGDATNTVNTVLENKEAYNSQELYDAFKEVINGIDSVKSDLAVKSSNLGSRMQRLDYVDKRLTNEKTTFKELLTETEGVDVTEVYADFNAEYMTYQYALKATSQVLTNTLADYL